jgi:hypothetical protein
MDKRDSVYSFYKFMTSAAYIASMALVYIGCQETDQVNIENLVTLEPEHLFNAGMGLLLGIPCMNYYIEGKTERK